MKTIPLPTFEDMAERWRKLLYPECPPVLFLLHLKTSDWMDTNLNILAAHNIVLEYLIAQHDAIKAHLTDKAEGW